MSVLLFAGVWLTLFLCVPYTMRSWEANGLFLNTPDYFQDMREGAHPMLQLCVDYISQFFYYETVGAAILALLPTLLFVVLGLIFRNHVLRILLATTIVCGVVIYVLRPTVREKESMAHLEFAAEAHRWNDVLKIVTPKVAREKRNLMPYALLALAINNELTERMYDYPVQGIEDFDTQGRPCHEYYFFKMVLYDCMGCPNEAIHNNFQAAAGTRYGTNFGTLRRLVRLNQDAGNPVLADKYKEILSHSTMHRNWHSKGEALPDTLCPNVSGQIPVITKSFGYNLAMFIDRGIRSPQMCNYFLCALLASNELDAFAKALERMSPILPQPLPPLYQEALQRYAEAHPEANGTPSTL